MPAWSREGFMPSPACVPQPRKNTGGGDTLEGQLRPLPPSFNARDRRVARAPGTSARHSLLTARRLAPVPMRQVGARPAPRAFCAPLQSTRGPPPRPASGLCAAGAVGRQWDAPAARALSVPLSLGGPVLVPLLRFHACVQRRMLAPRLASARRQGWRAGGRLPGVSATRTPSKSAPLSTGNVAIVFCRVMRRDWPQGRSRIQPAPEHPAGPRSW